MEKWGFQVLERLFSQYLLSLKKWSETHGVSMLIESVLYTMTGIVGLATKLSTTAVDLVLGTMSSVVGFVHEILGSFLDVVSNFLGLVNSLLENVAILKKRNW